MPPPRPPLRGRRAAAFGLRVEFDVADLVQFSRAISQQAQRARPALIKAHRDIGFVLQENIIEVLQEKINERGRTQRGSALIDALSNPNAIVATSTGFTFGFLENAQGLVRLYASNLEYGTPIHVGQIFDSFISAEGRFVPATSDIEAQTDPRLVRFTRRNPVIGPLPEGVDGTRPTRVRNNAKYIGRTEDRRHPPIVIKKPIPAYNYFKEGTQNFRRGNFGKNFSDMVWGVYKGWFEEYGLNYINIWFQQFGVIEPEAGEAVLRRTKGRAIRPSDPQY